MAAETGRISVLQKMPLPWEVFFSKQSSLKSKNVSCNQVWSSKLDIIPDSLDELFCAKGWWTGGIHCRGISGCHARSRQVSILQTSLTGQIN